MMSLFDRRSALALGGVAALAMGGGRAVAARQLGAESVKLWPGNAPGWIKPIPLVINDPAPAGTNRGLTGIGEPMMIVCRPAKPNGTGMLVMPGGGYVWEAFDNEGSRVAAWLNARGITAFILVYRLPAEGWTRASDVPLQDAQRAMRLIRANAANYGVAKNRLGVVGFSAGGHLSGSLATRFGESVYNAVDAADHESARPDVAAMVYPVVTLEPSFTHAGSRAALIGAGADAALTARYSVDRRVAADTPPIFIAQAADDTIVPIQNSLLMYVAMLAMRTPAALHLFEKGGHGFAVNLPPADPGHVWPDLFLRFAAAHDVIA